MTPDVAIDLVSEALYLIVLLVALVLTPGLLVGLVVSVFQAATQINEQTLSFLPRLLVTLVVLILAGPFIMQKLIDFAEKLIHNIPILIG
ncbi:flagellar biosynthetic protein FliQ [Oleiphilus sp. HI0071]|jgi:flagellar biosynthetic protein FliQ|nr:MULTISPECIES: flagellar biosynthesis protein FliQ [unclassified Oleiphilus]KZY61574.1 flagellar biosynthetic protein FliQ [Oleiphilus sp. HI0065]KZY83960.1 flagellar biosynthetic protein FliQ [Oleiphilus sp. HI0071]KZY91101.1 flagellar biosynthetic protein FliQ [Oleiphilus sp. HI0073]KZZ41421.1 flagellar biosynthetic protein FliQ [Oleiphilus sp. HI0118]KZZ52355.1 flagellar biosynthetic protein FliQ [Oleiphilus sp. HI0122]KZZ70939.1 flagellar biosynthetic protein FliQ [Oleiphilus sp. HI0130